jgi:hypothetical protein
MWGIEQSSTPACAVSPSRQMASRERAAMAASIAQPGESQEKTPEPEEPMRPSNSLPISSSVNSSSDKKPQPRRIATLGDAATRVTCSMAIAWQHFPHAELVGAPSFEAACSMVLAGKADAFLVAAAYPQLAAFFMNSKIEATDAFLAEIPELVLVGTRGVIDEVEVLFHHPATESLIQRLPIRVMRTMPSSSNETAVADMLGAGGKAAAITNALVAVGAGLKPLAVMRPGLQMGWLLFESRIGEAQ